MKSFLCTLLSVLTFGCINANEVSIAPNTSLTAGSASEVWFQVDLPSYNDVMQSVVINVTFPTGWQGGTSIANYADGCKWDYDFGEQGTSSHFAGSGAKQDDGSYNYLVYSIDTQPFKGYNGNVFSVKVKVPTGTADGYYPIIITKNTYATKSSIDAENITFTRDQISYIKVGNPTNASIVVPSGDLTTSATKSFDAGTTIDFSKATAVYGKCDNNVNATYTRTVANKWNTVCLPFTTKSTATVQYYEITGVGSDCLQVSGVSELNAGTPALVKVTGSELTAATAEGGSKLTTELTNGTMVGTFEPIKVTTPNTYYIKDNKFYAINDNFNLTAFKAYFTNPSTAKAGVLDIVEGETTSINALNAEGINEVYGADGVQKNNTSKGLNLVKMADGKVMKVIVK